MKKLVSILLLFNFFLSYSQVLCGTDQNMQEIEKKYPEIIKRRQELENERNIKGAENFRKELVARYSKFAKKDITLAGKTNSSYNYYYEIPIVVHVIVPTGAVLGSTYNPTDSQIIDWIERTNQIYATTYGNGYYPAGSGNDGGNPMPFRLRLAKRDQNGNAFNGIDRYDGGQIPGYNDYGVVKDSIIAGVTQSDVVNYFPHWNENQYINIYLVHKINQNDKYEGIVGWFNLPDSPNNEYHSFMKIATINYIQEDNGFVLSHELGHGLGLKHVFQGESRLSKCPVFDYFWNCNFWNDGVCDTAPSKNMKSINPLPPNNNINDCTGKNYDGIQYNIMNYTSSPRKFTLGQTEKAFEDFIFYRGDLTISPALYDVGYYNISANPNPIDCGSIIGAGLYQENQSVSLFANPNSNCNFYNWTEFGQEISNNPNITFTANRNRVLTANFYTTIPNYTIAVQYNYDAGSVTGNGTYQQGQSVTLTASPNQYYSFLNWSENGSVISTNQTINFIANRDRKVIANFTSNIKSYEYWFDNDFNNRISINNINSNLININQSFLNTHLDSKLHTFNYRAQDYSGSWSSVTSTYFVNKSKIIAYEYWFNDDYSNKVFSNITPNELMDLSLNINTKNSNLKKGINSLNFRTLDANNIWSSTISSYFVTTGSIIGYEYWFNDDYNNKVFNNISATNLLDLGSNINVKNANLNIGLNKFNFRAKDSNGNWSSAITTEFTFNGVLGIENIKDKTLKIYPNPASEFIFIETLNSPINELRLYDYNGRLINSEKVNSKNKQKLDISKYKSSSIYILEIITNNEIKRIKIIKK